MYYFILMQPVCLELDIWKLSTGHASKKKAQKKRAKGWPAESQPPAETYYRTTKTSKCHLMDCLSKISLLM
jgi:hypothetical protein